MVGLREMARLDAERAPPAWLRELLRTPFFEPCPAHPAATATATRSPMNAGANIFCVDCAGPAALCSRCVADGHAGHEVIQIRRMSGHNVVKVSAVEHLLNVSMVQTYLLNGEPAVFISKREVTGQGKPGVTTRCEECNRGLYDPGCRFCSMGCKAEGIYDNLDFSVSFAVNLASDSSEEE